MKLFTAVVLCLVTVVNPGQAERTKRDTSLSNVKAVYNRYITTSTGKATYYGEYPGGGACALDPLPSLGKQPGWIQVAAGKDDFQNSLGCGMCLEIRGSGKAAAPDLSGTTPVKGNLYGLVTDLCGSCKQGDLDLFLPGNGVWQIRFKAIDCPTIGGPAGHIQFRFTGSNEWYLKLQVRNTKLPVAGVEMFDVVNGEWRCLTRTSDNHFSSEGLGRLLFPLTVRLTSITDEQLESTITSLANDENIPTGVQFAGIRLRGGAPDNIKCYGQGNRDVTVEGDDSFCVGKVDGIYADRHYCTAFYMCSGDRTFRKFCPAGQKFNPLISNCDDPENVNCQEQDQQQLVKNTNNGRKEEERYAVVSNVNNYKVFIDARQNNITSNENRTRTEHAQTTTPTEATNEMEYDSKQMGIASHKYTSRARNGNQKKEHENRDQFFIDYVSYPHVKTKQVQSTEQMRESKDTGNLSGSHINLTSRQEQNRTEDIEPITALNRKKYREKSFMSPADRYYNKEAGENSTKNLASPGLPMSSRVTGSKKSRNCDLLRKESLNSKDHRDLASKEKHSTADTKSQVQVTAQRYSPEVSDKSDENTFRRLLLKLDKNRPRNKSSLVSSLLRKKMPSSESPVQEHLKGQTTTHHKNSVSRQISAGDEKSLDDNNVKETNGITNYSRDESGGSSPIDMEDKYFDDTNDVIIDFADKRVPSFVRCKGTKNSEGRHKDHSPDLEQQEGEEKRERKRGHRIDNAANGDVQPDTVSRGMVDLQIDEFKDKLTLHIGQYGRP